ncbi:MAG: hypothetical protein AAFR59_12755, partial [Bacteroidota bacterium]
SPDCKKDGTEAELFKRNLNYHVTQFYYSDVHPREDFFIGGSQDNAAIGFLEGGKAERLAGGDGSFVAFDRDEPEYAIACNNHGGAKIVKLDLQTGKKISERRLNQSGGELINPSGYDPAQNVFLNPYRGVRILRARNVTDFSDIVRDTIDVSAVVSSPITVLTPSPHSMNGESVFYLGTNTTSNGAIYRMSHAEADSPLMRITALPNPVIGPGVDNERGRWMTSLCIGDTEDHLIVTFQSREMDGIWETKDGGTTWQSKQGDLPRQRMLTVTRNPKNPKEVVVGGQYGVFYTQNFDAIDVLWEPLVTGVGRVKSTTVKYREKDSVLFLGSYGLGVLRHNIELQEEKVTRKTPYFASFSSPQNTFEFKPEWTICGQMLGSWEQDQVWRVQQGGQLNIQQREDVMVSKYHAFGYPRQSQLISPFIDFSDQITPQVVFEYAYPTADQTIQDTADLQYSLDDGDSWQMLWVKRGNALATTSTAASGTFVPDDSDWRKISIPVSFLRDEKRVLFRFTTYGDRMSDNFWLDHLNDLT